MENKKEDRFEITELFMFKSGANWHRRFLGSINRLYDNSGNQVIQGKVIVNDCCIYSMAFSEDELGLQIDTLVAMVLNEGLHSTTGKTIKICNTDFFFN